MLFFQLQFFQILGHQNPGSRLVFRLLKNAGSRPGIDESGSEKLIHMLVVDKPKFNPYMPGQREIIIVQLKYEKGTYISSSELE